MRNILGYFSILVALFLTILPDRAQAQIPERHQRLLLLTLQEITTEGNNTAYDSDLLGHIFFRCSILFSIMGEAIVAVIPAESPEVLRAKAAQARDNYLSQSELMMVSGTRIIELPGDQVVELFKEMHDVWSGDLINGGAQMFLKNDEGSAKALAGQSFKQQLEVCTSTSNELKAEIAKR